ncbi:MAG: hypothetical protein WC551_12760 [Patescibacteria group bacterium]
MGGTKYPSWLNGVRRFLGLTEAERAGMDAGTPITGSNPPATLLDMPAPRKDTVSTIAALRLVTGYADRDVRRVDAADCDYQFSNDSTAADDGDLSVKPADIVLPAPGRWIKGSASVFHNATLGTNVGDLQHLTAAEKSAIDGHVVSTANPHSTTYGQVGAPALAHGHTGAGDGSKLAQANTHESADTDAATTSLHHTVGTGANQAAAGNHAHTGVYTGVSHAHSGAANDGPKLVQANTHESADTDSAPTALHHTLGTGANQACSGTDARLSDARVANGGNADTVDGQHAAAFAPLAHGHTGTTDGSKLAQANTHESADTDSAPTALHHTLGTGANQACAGNDGRLSDARVANGGNADTVDGSHAAAFAASSHTQAASTITYTRTPVADAAHDLGAAETYIVYTSLSATRAVTLKTACLAYPDQEWIVADETVDAAHGAATHNITFTAESGTIYGINAIDVDNGAVRIRNNGTNWFVRIG